MEETTSMEKIKAELILSCINNDPKSFLPFLLLAEVETVAPNKKDFYQFFKVMLKDAHLRAKGELTVKIEEDIWETDKGIVNYNFYNNAFKHSLLSIEVRENNNQIYLDIMPF